MATKMVTDDPDREIKEAWEVFSMGEEYIPREQLKRIMENLGEVLTEEKINDLIEEADYNDDGKIDFSDFYKTIKNVK